MTGVEPRRKGSQHPLHAFDQRRFRRLDDQVKVVAHQTKGMDLPAGIDSSFSQGLDEPLWVAVVQDDIFPAIPAAEHMISCPFLYSTRSGRGMVLAILNTACQSVNFPLIRSDPNGATVPIRNANTRAAYYRAIQQFLAWVERAGYQDLEDIEPITVAAYIGTLQRHAAPPTVKQHMAAIRMLFSWLTEKGALAMNPAREVKTERFSRTEGKTPAFVEGEVQRLLGAVETSTHTGLRDRALLGVLAYTFARIGAAVNLKVEDYYPSGKRFYSALKRKAVKRKSFPSTTSWRNSWTNTSKRPASAPSQVLLCSGRLGQNRQVIAPAARAHRRRRHAQATAQASWIAGSLFASLIPGDRHHEFSGK